MIKKTIKKINFIESFIWLVLIVSAFTTSYLPIFQTPIGLMYLYRLALPLALVYYLIKAKALKGYAIKITLICFLALLGYGALSIIWAREPMQAVRTLLNYVYSIMAILVLCLACKNRKSLERIILVLWVVLVAIAIMGLYESLNGHLFQTIEEDVWVSSVFGMYPPILFFTNQNDFALLLVLFLPLIIAYASKRKIVFKIFALITTVLLVANIIFSNSRLALILLALYVYLWLWFKAKKMAIVLGLIGIVIAIINIGSIITFLGLGPYGDIVQNYRLVIWLNGLIALVNSFGFGVGAGNYTAVTGYAPHFWLIELLVEYGIIIFVIIMLWWVYSIKRLYANKSKDSYKTAFLMGLITMPLWSMMAAIMSATPFVWIYFGLMIAFVSLPIKKTFVLKQTKIKIALNKGTLSLLK